MLKTQYLHHRGQAIKRCSSIRIIVPRPINIKDIRKPAQFLENKVEYKKILNVHKGIPMTFRGKNFLVVGCARFGKKMTSKSLTERKNVLPEISKDVRKTSLNLSIRLPNIKIQRLNTKIESNICESPQQVLNETTTIFCNLGEVCKIIKFRGEDIVTMDRLISPSEGIESLQLIDDIISTIRQKEAKRNASESQSLAGIKGIYVDSEEIKKNMERLIKKVTCEFGRRYFSKEPQENSVVSHLNYIMQDQNNKAHFFQDRELAIILKDAFNKSRVNPEYVCQVCLLYTKLMFYKRLKRVMEIYNKTAGDITREKKIWIKQIATKNIWIHIENMQQQYQKICQDKAFEALMIANKRIAESINEYKEQYEQNKANHKQESEC